MSDILMVLTEKYNRVTITRKEFADELGVSLSTIDKLISNGSILPKLIKLGDSTNATARFNIIEVAQFINKGGLSWDTQLFQIPMVFWQKQ